MNFKSLDLKQPDWKAASCTRKSWDLVENRLIPIPADAQEILAVCSRHYRTIEQGGGELLQ